MKNETIRHTDYSKELSHIDFKYDNEYYPTELPDPQKNPVIPGACIGLQKVGVGPIDLPLKMLRRDKSIDNIIASTSLYGSVDDSYTKGLNFSRFYRLMHEEVNTTFSVEVINRILTKLIKTQHCKDGFCKFRFKYHMLQSSLRSRKQLPENASEEHVFKVIDGVKLSHEKQVGHIFYPCKLEGRIIDNKQSIYLTVKYTYGSTCPCSFTLADHARTNRGKAANGHSQRSIATVTVEINNDYSIWIEDLVELLRKQIPTEVTVYMKRIDEQAQAELSGSNLLFTEDANRLIYEGLDNWYNQGKINDFSIVTVHQESIHPYDAIAVSYKGKPNGLR